MIKNKKSLFICLEGADGSGKTTQVNLLSKCFKKVNNIPVFCYREPGGNIINNKIRELFLEYANELEAFNQILLLTVSRNILLKENIIPKLKEGDKVILDRYILSTLVYQALGDNMLVKLIKNIHKINNNLYPDLTLILDVNPEEALKRLEKRTNNNCFDKKPLSYHTKIIDLYKQMKDLYPAKSYIIDANLEISTIHSNIVSLINKNFNLNLKPLNKEEIKDYLEYNFL